jgi:GntR family transcriptional regulator, rspAB operon transcriptional repressor
MLEPLTVRQESLTTRVYEALREAIVDSRLPAGDRVVESQLAAQLEVSKTPVREALLRLAQVGLVETDAAGRTRVTRPSLEGLQQAFELRIALEVEGVRIAAARAGASEVGMIEAYAGQSLTAAERGDGAEFRRFDRLFHRALAEATTNPRLRDAVHDSLDLIGALRLRDVMDTHSSVRCARHHIDIGEHVRGHDGEAAAAAMREHLEEVRAIVAAGFRDAVS